jgi:hypothetical protein
MNHHDFKSVTDLRKFAVIRYSLIRIMNRQKCKVNVPKMMLFIDVYLHGMN